MLRSHVSLGACRSHARSRAEAELGLRWAARRGDRHRVQLLELQKAMSALRVQLQAALVGQPGAYQAVFASADPTGQPKRRRARTPKALTAGAVVAIAWAIRFNVGAARYATSCDAMRASVSDARRAACFAPT